MFYFLIFLQYYLNNNQINKMKKVLATSALSLFLFSVQSAVINTNQMFGQNNVVHYGQKNKINGKDNQVSGFSNDISGNVNLVYGDVNDLNGNLNLVRGDGNSVSGTGNLVSGQGNIVVGENSSEQDKQKVKDKLMEMFASRGLGGLFGAISPPQVPDSTHKNSPVIKNQQEANKTQIQVEQPKKVAPVQEPSKRAQQKVYPVQVKQQQKPVNSQIPEDKQKGQSGQQVVIPKKDQTHFDYNTADNDQTALSDDMIFFEKSEPQVLSKTTSQDLAAQVAPTQHIEPTIQPQVQKSGDTNQQKPVQEVTPQLQSQVDLPNIQQRPVEIQQVKKPQTVEESNLTQEYQKDDGQVKSQVGQQKPQNNTQSSQQQGGGGLTGIVTPEKTLQDSSSSQKNIQQGQQQNHQQSDQQNGQQLQTKPNLSQQQVQPQVPSNSVPVSPSPTPQSSSSKRYARTKKSTLSPQLKTSNDYANAYLLSSGNVIVLSEDTSTSEVATGTNNSPQAPTQYFNYH